jgi:uncharacterized membrane protein YhaH (DUF805 family)
LDNIAGTTFKLQTIGLPYGFIYLLYSLFVIIPGLAVLVRRLHDVGKSGWWMFIALVPIIGWIWILVLLFTDSNAGENLYGPNPKTGETKDLLDFPS